jgi:two-component system cell cycle response regulator
MRGVRRFTGAVRSASFSMKFAAVILVAGSTIAVVPLLLADSNTRSLAEHSAANKIGIAANLISGQRASLAAFVSGVARQIVAAKDAGSTAAVQETLTADAEGLETNDVLGVVAPGGAETAVQGSTVLPAASALAQALLSAVDAGAHNATSPDGTLWLVETAPVSGERGTALVARPVTATFVSAIDHNLATAADPVDVLLIRADGRFALGGSLGASHVSAGDVANPTLRSAMASPAPEVVTLDSRRFAVASTSLGAGLTLVVTSPVTVPPVVWPSILLLLGVILVAMLFIVVVVQIDLRMPLRRLDNAVAALGNGDFDLPVRAGSADEVGRLGASFEAMRLQVRATMRATAARASVATELSQAQPLDVALARVCDELRESIGVEMAMIVVNESEMGDPFAVTSSGRHLDAARLLEGTGPLGEGYRHPGRAAILLGATAPSAEAHLGVRQFCVAPLRLGTYVHGVLALADHSRAFTNSDRELVGSTAEQISLALERYRFLAVVQRQATVDDLTGLYNHRFLVDSLGQQVALAERIEAPLAVLMIDIDHFKLLNDTHGHHAGDAALATFARTLLGNVRRADLAARYGGEEFVVVMPSTSAEEAFLVAEKIRLAVEVTDVTLPGGSAIRLTVSIGVAAYPEHTRSAADLFSLADEALYRAKRTGRQRTCVAGAAPAETSPRVESQMGQDAHLVADEVNIRGGRSRSTK